MTDGADKLSCVIVTEITLECGTEMLGDTWLKLLFVIPVLASSKLSGMSLFSFDSHAFLDY